MYYEEKIIDNVLHCRLTKTDEFKPISSDVLTLKILELRKRIDELRDRLDREI